MPLPPPPVTQAEALAALSVIYDTVQRLLRGRLGRGTRTVLVEMRAQIAALLNRHDQGC
jgi:hypothetical protein